MKDYKMEQWKKFCQAKEDCCRALDMEIANCLLEEAGSDVRLAFKEEQSSGDKK